MTQPSQENAVRSHLEKHAAAVRAKDPDRVIACYASDVVIYSLAPPLGAQGPAALDRDELVGWFETWQGPIGYDLRDIVITVSGDLAMAHGFVRISGIKQDGQANAVWTRLTVGLARRGDAWTISHEHMSTPFYMDGSYKAAVDLHP